MTSSKHLPQLNVACLQAELAWEQPLVNQQRLKSMIKEGDIAQGTVVVLPEMFATGFSMDAQRVSQPMNGPSVRWMRQLSDEMGIVLAGSLAITDGRAHYNRLLWVAPGEEEIAYYDKRHLFTYAGEDESYTKGAQRMIFKYAGWRILPQVCYDLRFPVWSRNQDDYDVMLYVANWPLPRVHAWQQLLPARAVENQAYVIGCNRVGSDGNKQLYTGRSIIIDMVGDTLADAGDQEAMIKAELSMERLTEFRTRYPFLNDRDAFHLT